MVNTIKAWAIVVKGSKEFKVRGTIVCPAPSTTKDCIGNQYTIFEDRFSAKAKMETYPDSKSFKVVPCKITLTLE